MEPAVPKWDRHSILAEFRRQGVRLADYAEQNGRNAKSFSAVWTRWNRVDEQLIADFLGEAVEAVWPDRYPVTSTRIFPSSGGPGKASPEPTGAAQGRRHLARKVA